MSSKMSLIILENFLKKVASEQCSCQLCVVLVCIVTRETAFVVASICAGIYREVARKCKEQDLESCSCDFSGTKDAPDEKTTIIEGCGDNCEFGDEIAECFAACNGNSCVATKIKRNCELGRQVR